MLEHRAHAFAETVSAAHATSENFLTLLLTLPSPKRGRGILLRLHAGFFDDRSGGGRA